MKRTKKRAERMRAKRASRASGTNPGGKSDYAKKVSGKRKAEYRIEGGLLLTPEELARDYYPGPLVITTKVVTVVLEDVTPRAA